MLTQSWQTLANLFLQQICPLCDRATPQPLCANCWHQLQPRANARPPQPPTAALPIVTWGAYEGALKQAIAALKYHGQPQLAMPLGQALGQHWQQFPLKTVRPPLVVPIPMHPEKQRQRGFNQAELLAKAFCQQTGLLLVHQGLVRRKVTTPQFGLGLQARQQNLANAFIVGPAFNQHRPTRPVLLLDDIYTTGTTVKVAAAELRRWGISVCGVVTLASAVLEKSRQMSDWPADADSSQLSRSTTSPPPI
ncbi:MAG: ComF family protein [Cyanobacteria bacterium P01_A01_bin.70]